MAYLSTSAGETVIYAQLAGLDTNYSRDDRFIYWYIDGSFEGSMDVAAYASSSNLQSFTGLSPGTTYLIEATIYYTDINGTQSADFSSNVTTDEPTIPKLDTPTILYTNVGSTTIYIDFSTVSNADTYVVEIFNDDENFKWGTYTSSISSINISGLETETNYSAAYHVENDDPSLYEDSSVGWYSFLTEPKQPPTPFSWATSVTSGVEFNITAYDWNNLTTKVNEFRSYSELGSIFFPEVSIGDSFLASQFNSVRSAIATMNYVGTLPSIKSSGDVVRAVDLNDLVDCLNSIT